tara:strand:+ start:489 stop:689 length:201 start_codon:yes stop_codon:yes gene_type:complete
MVCGARIVLETFCTAAIMWLVLHCGIHPSLICWWSNFAGNKKCIYRYISRMETLILTNEKADDIFF